LVGSSVTVVIPSRGLLAATHSAGVYHVGTWHHLGHARGLCSSVVTLDPFQARRCVPPARLYQDGIVD
jgi:hypothetical protein